MIYKLPRIDPDPEHSGEYAEEDYHEGGVRRRRGAVIVVVLLGLAVLTAAGAFSYRAMLGGSVMRALPPIIKPADSPLRVKPGQISAQGEADPAKGAGDQVVINQEQPVDVQSGNPIPRMIKTIPVVPNGPPDPGSAAGQSPAGSRSSGAIGRNRQASPASGPRASPAAAMVKVGDNPACSASTPMTALPIAPPPWNTIR